ncbi:hypothetical protein BGW80DRAFT_1379086 [Lactifluus volemus]|nr:hypothetical protein BGW80DRAFT_1379086 [Lactifluus volemus]
MIPHIVIPNHPLIFSLCFLFHISSVYTWLRGDHSYLFMLKPSQIYTVNKGQAKMVAIMSQSNLSSLCSFSSRSPRACEPVYPPSHAQWYS